MKKFLIVLCAALLLTLSGCFGSKPSYENLDTTQAVDLDKVTWDDCEDNLDGLVKYFKKINFLPGDTTPTDMLSEVIGSKKGYRYIFTVDGSNVVVELYEYDTKNLDDSAKRVIGEIRETGSFHLFNKEGIDDDETYEATMSDSGKYMMIYTDGSGNESNVTRKKQAIEQFKKFHSGSASGQTSTQTSEQSSSQTSEQTSAQASAQTSTQTSAQTSENTGA